MSIALNRKIETPDLEAVAALIHEALIILNEKSNIIYINHAAETVLEIKTDGNIGQHIDKVLPGVGSLDSLRTGEIISRELKYGNKDLLFNASAVTKNGTIDSVILVFHDMSGIKSKERELADAKELIRELEAIFNFSYDGIFVTDGNAVGLRLNESYIRVTGIQNAREMIGMTMGEAVAQGFVSESVSLKVLEKKGPISTSPKLKSGKKVIMTGNPVFDEQGKIIRVITNVRDITELISLNAQLEEMRKQSVRYLSEVMHWRSQCMNFPNYIIASEAMKKIVETAIKVAYTDAPVLIMGDSGSGKEVIARIIHENSGYKAGPFFKINFGAIPDTLLESELFGYEKGAFTSASKQGKMGLFELANEGTLFLDEIGEIPMQLQTKLLGVLQDLKFTRVGGVEQKNLRARIIAASNRDLEEMVNAHTFRKDLYYRINVVSLKIPSLAQRKDAIFPLANFFLNKFSKKYNTHKTFSSEVMAAFSNYEWPGNIREMEHVIERLVVLSPDEQITLEWLPEELKSQHFPMQKQFFLDKEIKLADIIVEVENRIFSEFCRKGYSTYKMAQILGISQSTVVRKLQRTKKANKSYEP
jgi:PAS domain S-box-containing protein